MKTCTLVSSLLAALLPLAHAAGPSPAPAPSVGKAKSGYPLQIPPDFKADAKAHHKRNNGNSSLDCIDPPGVVYSKEYVFPHCTKDTDCQLPGPKKHTNLPWTNENPIVDSLINYGQGYCASSNSCCAVTMFNDDEDDMVAYCRSAVTKLPGGSSQIVVAACPKYLDDGTKVLHCDLLGPSPDYSKGPFKYEAEFYCPGPYYGFP